MRSSTSARRPVALAALVAASILLSACGAGSLGSSGDGSGSGGGGGKTTISYLVDNSEASVKPAEQLARDFTAKNPDITVKVETRPQGGEGDNIVKTRLQTGDMADVFAYNSGSLFQALAPKQNLQPVTDESWVQQVEPSFLETVKSGEDVYGAPFGSAMGGGILYNRSVYEKLGLNVPMTWAEFMTNNAAMQKAGVTPVIQTYQDTWTSQLFVLGDYHNVAAQNPDFAEQYTANKVKYATDPAGVKGFEKLEQVHKAGYLNKDFASTKLEDGLRKLAAGEGAHYPMLTFAVGPMVANNPKAKTDVGFFAIPGDDADKNGLTIWAPAGAYIPKSTEGDKLEAAKKFLAYIASPEGCESQTKALTPSGPYLVEGCELPADLPQATKDLESYFDKEGATTPALEFLSPVKGPALEQITVEVGSGIRSAKDGAALYDKDVEKQAQQLGLEGW